MANTIGPNDGSTHVRAAFAEGWQADEGCYLFQSSLTPEGRTSLSTGCIPSNRVMPIIFVPGIMGSNLKAKRDILDGTNEVAITVETPVWRVDSTLTLAKEWVNRKQDQYQLRFQYDKVTVDDRGVIEVSGKPDAPQLTPLARLTETLARARGWGTVSAEFYGGFLDWLDSQLNQAQRELRDGQMVDNTVLTSLKQHATRNPSGMAPEHDLPALTSEDINVLLKANNPVHAFGYNWLQTNIDSGKALATYIDQTIQHYVNDGFQCDKVILVTHSMGGLVARAACTVAGAGDKVAGVFHSVMPTDGAAATYKRMVSGFEGEPTHGAFGWFTDWVGALALGPTGDYVTPAMALNAGPLELLPNARYNGGEPWLIVRDPSGVVRKLPSAQDPYNEIYLEQSAWWRLINEEWLNPAGLNLADGWLSYSRAVEKAQLFHTKVQATGDFHKNTHAHYGVDRDYLAYGTVSWKLRQTVDAARHTTLQREKLPGVQPLTGMEIYLHDAQGGSHASLSDPDAQGDGTVPAQASAMAVDSAVAPGNLLVRDTGYSHDKSYQVGGKSAGPMAALQAIVRVLKAEVQA